MCATYTKDIWSNHAKDLLQFKIGLYNLNQTCHWVVGVCWSRRHPWLSKKAVLRFSQHSTYGKWSSHHVGTPMHLLEIVQKESSFSAHYRKKTKKKGTKFWKPFLWRDVMWNPSFGDIFMSMGYSLILAQTSVTPKHRYDCQQRFVFNRFFTVTLYLL